MFDLPFAAHGLFFGLEGFVIDKSDRKAGLGVFGAFSGIVGLDTFFQIVGPTSVKGIVTAFYNIGVG